MQLVAGRTGEIEELRELAHERRRRIIELGQEVEGRKQEQARWLLWFYDNPASWQALGYESFREFFFQEDLQQAIGVNATSQGAESRVFSLTIVNAAVPEAAVFGPGHSKVEAAMPLLRPMAAAALNAPPERAAKLKRTLLKAVDHYRDLTYREVTHQVQKRRPSPYHLTSNGGHPAIAELNEETGEVGILLVQTDECDSVGAGRAMARLLKSRTLFTWDEEGIWTQIEKGVWKLALRWVRGNIPYKVKERVAQDCKAERRI